MPSMRWFYAAFWSLIAVMLLWQFLDYNQHIDKLSAQAATAQKHFYFYNNSTNTATGEAMTIVTASDGADVQKVKIIYQPGVPTPGYITCHITVKNLGNMNATHVVADLKPYRGAMVGDPDGGRSVYHALSDSDPAAQTSLAIYFPDLAPGQSETKDVSFYAQPRLTPNGNPSPQITFKSEPVKPPAPAAQ